LLVSSKSNTGGTTILRQWTSTNRDKVWAYGIGIGLSLYAIHWKEQPFLNYIFLPQLGFCIVMGCLMWYFAGLKHKPDLGPKYIWIPMLVIVISIMARLIIDFSMETIAGALLGIVLFALYIVSRQAGKDIFAAFIPFVIIVAVSCIINGITYPGEITGGIITNYCAAAGFMIFGTIVYQFKWQWLLSTVVLIALFFVGALEAVFTLVILGSIVLLRKDWSKKLILPVSLVSLTAIVWLALGHITPLYSGNKNLETVTNIVTGQYEIKDDTINIITTNRWEVIQLAMSNIQPLGHGYKPGVAEAYTVHNVPLVIVDQIGPVAGIAWLFITIFCLVKTKWKYAWATILALSVFDHYIWTQFAPYWWALAGVSAVPTIKHDYVFRNISSE